MKKIWKSLLAPSFKPVNLWPKSSLIYSRTFITGFDHFHGSTRSAQALWRIASHQSQKSCQEHSQNFSRACIPWKRLAAICLAYMLPLCSPALVFVSSTWSSQVVTHPNTIQAQCCLTSVFELERVFPTCHGPLTQSCKFIKCGCNSSCYISRKRDAHLVNALCQRHAQIYWNNKGCIQLVSDAYPTQVILPEAIKERVDDWWELATHHGDQCNLGSGSLIFTLIRLSLVL